MIGGISTFMEVYPAYQCLKCHIYKLDKVHAKMIFFNLVPNESFSDIVHSPGKGFVGAVPISQGGTGMTSRVKGQSKVSLVEWLVLTHELSYSKPLSPIPRNKNIYYATRT